MATAHARRKSSRALTKAHPGQLKGSARKRKRQEQAWHAARLERAHRRLAETNKAQQRQNQVKCRIVIDGLSRWEDAFAGMSISVRPSYAKHFGAEKMPALEFFAIEASLYRDVSFERGVLSDLMTRGYELEELEVEIDSKKEGEWGVCTWYKEHPSYNNPRPAVRKLMPKVSPKALSFYDSVLKTEHAGDQHFTLLSMQMLGNAIAGLDVPFLFHKALVFRKVVLSPPGGRPEFQKAA